MSYKENIQEIKIPKYTKAQERFNTISHLLGIPLAFIVLIISLIILCRHEFNPSYLLSIIVFVITMIDVYFVSSLYHSTPLDSENKKVFRVLDHCTIYLLIAGTYTPICVFLMSEHLIGLIMLIIEWSLAALGILLNALFFRSKVVQVISLFLYLAMGWLVLFCGAFVYMTSLSFGFILAGGIIYSIGAILYNIGKKNLWFHCIFHVFVLLSTIIQSIGVMVLFF